MNPVSVTIRPGKAAMLNLGSSNIAPVLSYLREFPEHIIATEKVGSNADSIHLQCSLLTNKLSKNIRRRLLDLLKKAGWNEVQLKHGLHVKAHDDFFKLSSYCAKQGNIISKRIPSLGLDFDFYIELYHDVEFYDEILSRCLEHSITCESDDLSLPIVKKIDGNVDKHRDCSKHANVMEIIRYYNQNIYK